MNPVGLRLFRRENCLSYLVYDTDAGAAAFVDADRALLEEYRVFLSEYGLKPAAAWDTGACADHQPASALLGERYGIAPAAPSETKIGALRLRRLDSAQVGGICLLLEGLEPAIAFLGADSSIGREPARPLRGLPANTVLYPAQAREEVLFSTLENENARAVRSAENFSDPPVTAITIEKYETKVGRPKAGDLFVDVREPSEFADSHIPGTRNIPLSVLGLHLAELRGYARIYLSCFSGRRSTAAARTLAYVGLGSAVNVMGGFQAWKNAGFDVASGA